MRDQLSRLHIVCEGILCEALKEADSGGLEVLDGVCGRRRVGVRWRVRDDYAR